MQYYNVRYSTTLNDAQLDYLSDDDREINRMMCFKTFLRMATKEDTTVTKKNFSAGISVGQFAVSKVELAALWHCDRKTATRIIKEFNAMDILTSIANNRTTIHTLNSLSVWFTGSGRIKNTHFKINPYVRPIEKKVKPMKKTVHVPAGNSKSQAEMEDNEISVGDSSSLSSSHDVGVNAGKEDTVLPSVQMENGVTVSNDDSAVTPDAVPTVVSSTGTQSEPITDAKVNPHQPEKKPVNAQSHLQNKHHHDKSRKKKKRGKIH